MILQILELHKNLRKDECVKLIGLNDYETYLDKADLISKTEEPEVLRIVGVNGRTAAVNCNHITAACVTKKIWRD